MSLPQPQQTRPLLTTRQVAEKLGVSVQMVRAYAREHWLKARTSSGKLGRGRKQRFDPDEVQAFQDGGAAAAEEYRKRKARRGRKG